MLALGLLFGAFVGGADAARKKKKKKRKPVRVTRVVEIPYQCPCGPSWGQPTPVTGSGAGFWLAGGAIGGGFTASGPKEKFVKVEVIDESGQTVKVDLAQNVDGTDNFAEVPIGTVCGTTGKKSLKVPSPGVQVDAFVYEGLCDGGSSPSVALGGVIKLTFSNLP
jgi:hypothetical protein